MESNKTADHSQALINAANSEQFVCVGTEPFWGLTIGIHDVKGDYAGDAIAMQPSQPRSAEGMSKDWVVVYETRSLGAVSKPVTIVLQKGQCDDGMSDEVFPFFSTIITPEKILSGCCKKR